MLAARSCLVRRRQRGRVPNLPGPIGGESWPPAEVSSAGGTHGVVLNIGICGLAEVDSHCRGLLGVRRCFVQSESLVEATQWCGRPPVAFAEEPHRCGYEEHADDGGVDEDSDGKSDAELLDGEDF